MTHDDILVALESLRPNAQFVLRGTEIEYFGDDRPTDAEIAAEAIRLTPPVESPSEKAMRINIAAIQAELDRLARGEGYDHILSACSYAAQPNGYAFQAEGAAFLKWRSDVWTHAYAVLAEVEAGTTPMPTPAEAVAMMPALVLP